MHTSWAGLIGLLLIQVILTAFVRWGLPDDSLPAVGGLAWSLFLYAIPLGLVGALLARQRWACMAGVMYATVGLALDIATFVYGLTHEEPIGHLLLRTGFSAVLNFSMIVAGGYGFLSGGQGWTLSESRFPNPRPQSSV